ncbi:MAG: hypothetical protein ABR915_23630 [Thermoguttaceae bacterium]|jgi:hypothetical protein
MRVWSLAAVVALGFVTAAQAVPLDPKFVPAGATWVAHVDVDAVRACTVTQKAYDQCLEKHKDAVEKGIATVREKLGMDPRTDLHGITLYGPKIGQHKGVMIVQADVDQKLLTERVKKAQDYKSTKYGSYDISSWTAKGKMGQHPAAGAFWKPGVTVLGDSPESVQFALDVLDGKKPSMAKGSPLVADLPAGATVVVRATGIAEAQLPGRSPLPKQIESLCFAMGEYQGTSFLNAKVVTKTPETADQIKKIIEGGKAMAQLQHGGDADAAKMIDQLKVSVSDKTVAVDFHAPAADVWTHLQKVVKHIKEMHQQGKTPWGGKPAPEKK